MAYINNTYKPNANPVSPAWKSFGSQYKVTPTSIVKKNGYSYSPSTSLLTGKPISPALMGGSKKMGPVQSLSQPTSGLVTPPSSNVSTATPPQTNPQPEVGTTTTVGTVPAANQTRMLKSDRDAQARAQRGTDTSFGGTVRGLIDRSKTSNEQKRLLAKLEQEAQANKAIGEQARSLSEDYGKQIAEVGRLGAGAVAGNLSTGSNLVGSGNAAIASQSASQRMQALGQAQTAALQGTGQQLSATSQLTNALTSGLGAQQAQQSGLSRADAEMLFQEKLANLQIVSAIQNFIAAKDDKGNPKYPHFETVRQDMDGLLRAGLAKDLESAYSKALRMHDDIWEAEVAAKHAASQKAQQEAQAKQVAKAKAAAISPKTATPGAEGAKATKGIRASIEAAVDAHSVSGRV